jgi:hypothetical protein
VVQYLFKEHEKETLKPGLWHIKIKTNSSIGPLFVKAYFLILPSLTPRENVVTDVLENLVKYLWKFDKFCWKVADETKIDKNKQFLYSSPHFETHSCGHRSSYWSSFFPDPKSEFKKFI